MTNRREAILEFRRAADQPIRTEPTLDVPEEEKILAVELIAEELRELVDALEADNLVATADAFGDLQVVVEQLGPTFGIDGERLFAEVHRSNMSKVDPATGKMPKKPNGKAGKGPNFFEPDIESVLFSEPEPEQPAFEDIDPRVDIVVAPTLAIAKATIPIEAPELAQLPAYSPLHLRRSQSHRGRSIRNVYATPGAELAPGAADTFTELRHAIAQSGLEGRIITLRS
jgi:NTP pyrophosphatase (non-canonical NTP hydrolase)